MCFLGLVLMRVDERATSDTWRNMRGQLARMHLGTFAGSAGRVTQRTETTPRQRELLRDLDIAEPAGRLRALHTPLTQGEEVRMGAACPLGFSRRA